MNVIEINIGNKQFTVKTDEDSTHVKKVENMINEQLDVFAVNNRKYNEVEKHIFTSFVICDKYVKLLQKISDIEAEYKLNTQESKEKLISLYNDNEELRKKLDTVMMEKTTLLDTIEQVKIKNDEFKNNITQLENQISSKEQVFIQNEVEIEGLRNQVSSLNEKCEELSNDREKFLIEADEFDKIKAELNSRISKLLNKLNEKDQHIQNNEKALNQAKKENNDLNTKIGNINKGTKDNANIISNLKSEKDKLKEENKILKEKLAEKDDIIGQNYKFIEELKILKEEISKRHDRVNNEKEKYLEELLNANNNIESLNFTINELNDKLNRKDSEIYQNEVCIGELKKENTDLMKLLDEATLASER